jgi:WD40 repeat protein
MMERVAFSPDGKILASSSGNSIIRLWDVATGKEIRRIGDKSDEVHLHGFSPDGKTLAVESSGEICLKEVKTGREVRRFPLLEGTITSVVFAPGGKTLVSAGQDPLLRLWDTASGRLRRTFKGHRDMVDAVAIAPDGKTLASGSRDKSLRLWDMATGKVLHTWAKNKDSFSGIAFAPDGRSLAAADWDGAIGLWDLARRRQVWRVQAHKRTVASLAFSPDGKVLASGAEYSPVRLWDVATGKARPESRDLPPARRAVFSPDGKSLALWGDDHALHLWEVRARREKAEGHCQAVESVAVSPNSRLIASAGWDGVRLWEAGTGKQLLRLKSHDGKRVSCVAFAPDGKTLASGGSDGTVRLWEAATGRQLKKLKGAEPSVYCLAYSPDGTRIFAGAFRFIQVWETATGKVLRRLRVRPDPDVRAGYERIPPLSDLVVSPDGRVVAVMADWVCLWDAATGKKIDPAGILAKPGFVSKPLVFSPDGKTLACSQYQSAGDSTLCLLEAATGKERCRIPVRWPDGVAFSPDGRLLAGGGEDVRVWHAATGKELCRFRGHQGSVRSVAFLPNGKALASGSSDTTVLLWRVNGQRAPRLVRKPENLWKDLAAENASRAHRALWDLVDNPGRATPFLKARLRPVAPADPHQVARLLADLESKRYAVRRRATQELANLQELAEPALRKALQGRPSLEVQRRVERLLAKLASLRWNPTSKRLRLLRALEVLEHIGTPGARQVLKTLAGGAPASPLTQEAKASLERLAKRTVCGP